MSLLEGRKVTRRFGGIYALWQVDLSIEEGEILGLIGPNGAGKTTLFNVITGAFRPTSGSVTFEGREITGLRPHEICRLGIARTFQIPKPFPTMSVYENVFAASTFGSGKRRVTTGLDRDISFILERLGLSKKSQTEASRLTIFEQRMLEIARALATRPKLLLLDEVMAGLNPKETLQVLEIIGRLRQEGITIFMIEHNMRAIMGISDRVIVLNQGMKIAEGSPEAIGRDQRVIEAYLGEEYVAGR